MYCVPVVNPLAQRRAGHEVDVGGVQHLPDSFVIDEEEHFVLFDGSAQSSAELVAAERRRRAGVEEAARIQIAVAEELVERTVKFVGARFGHGDNRSAVAAILGSKGTGQGLEFGDAVDAQRSAGHVAAGIPLPPIQDIFAIQCVGVSFRTRPGDGIGVGHRGERGASARGISGHAGSEQNQLLKVTAVERQLPHLRLVHQRRNGRGGSFHLRRLRRYSHGLRSTARPSTAGRPPARCQRSR